jgi:ABC-type bacteriocin/lantibiotic exporter with double-glycine peptidase domain
MTALATHLDMSADGALRVLEQFSRSAHVAFDRIVAVRVLSEAERAIPGTDAATWSRRLVEVGESLNLRIRTLDGTLDDMLTFARQGIPVATCLEEDGGAFHWLLVTEARGRKVRIPALAAAGEDGWLTVRRLQRLLGLQVRSDHRRWVIGQSALGCELASRHAGGHGPNAHPTPLARLWALLQPERQDLWVILIFSIVVGLLALAAPIAVEALVNTVAFGRYLQPVIVLAVILFVFLAFAAAIRGLNTYVTELIQRRLFIRVVEDLAYRLPRAQQQALDQVHGPELVNRFFEIPSVQKAVATLLLDGLAIVLQTVVGMAVLAFYHPFLLGYDIVLLLLIGFIVFGLGRGAAQTAIGESRAKYALAAWLQELARHPTAFKMHAGNQFALDRADQLAINWLGARRTHFRILMRQILFALGLQALAATALLGLGGWLVIQGELTLGQLVAAELIVVIIVGSFAKIGKHMESFYDLLASAEKLGHLFDLPTEPHDTLFHLRDATPADVKVRNVTLSFGDVTVLRHLDLHLRPGDTVALTGPPGSGKSTLIELICGMRQPDSGHIELDGVDLRQLRPDSLREHLAVARSIEVFHGTIEENVHLNRTNISALDVREALAAVGLLDEILTLPDGLGTVLQTHGPPLSKSQRYRLMLARAIVGRPRLLLIDGTLDGLPDQLLVPILRNLTSRHTPWTLLATTGRKEVIDACGRLVTLTDTALIK